MEVLSKIYVANVAFHNVTMEEAVAQIVQMAQKTGKPRYVCTGNLDHLVTLEHDPEFRAIYQKSDLTLADGKPVVVLSRLAATSARLGLKERVTGSDLFWELARASESTGLRLFFLGGAPCAADLAKDAVLRRHPAAQICGTYCPPFETFSTEEEQQRIREIVRAAQPDILLVGFGAPKQEKWIAANKDLLSVPVSIGVGGSFEMAGGVVKRAPKPDAGLWSGVGCIALGRSQHACGIVTSCVTCRFCSSWSSARLSERRGRPAPMPHSVIESHPVIDPKAS